MQLAFKCNAFAGRLYSLESAICAISNAGFRSIGLVYDRPYLWHELVTPDAIPSIQRMFGRRNLSVASVSACTASGYERSVHDLTPPGQRFGPSFCSRHQSERVKRVIHTIRVLHLAKQLDCHYVDVSTGYQPAHMDYVTAWKLTKESLQAVCKSAETFHISINIEYEPGEFGPGGLFVGSALSALAMCNDVDSPALGVNLDLIHAAVCGEDIPATIRLLGDRLRVVEFDDMRSVRDAKGILRRKHEHLIPGEGELAEQYPAIFEALAEIGFNGPVIVELYNHFDKNPEEACRRSYEYLMKYFGKYFD